MSSAPDGHRETLEDNQAGERPRAEIQYPGIPAADSERINASVLQLLGALSLQAGRHSQARQLLSRSVELSPDLAAAHCYLGNALLQEGKSAAAIAAWQEALKLCPGIPEVHFNLGVVFFQQGDLGQAAENLQIAVHLQPNYSEAYGCLGDVLKQQGELDEAVSCYRQVTALVPEDATAHLHLGIALRLQGRLEEALPSIHESLRLRPDCAEAYVALGSILQDLGRLTDAQDVYQRALEFNPQDASAYHNLGLILQRLNRSADAVASVRTAVQLEPNSAHMRYTLGTLLVESGELVEGVACYERAVQLQPSFATAYNNLGLALQQQGDNQRAITCFREAVRLDPTLAESHLHLGSALLDEGELAQGIQCCQEAVRLSPDHVGAHVSLGMAQLLSGDFEHGWREYDWRLRDPEVAAKYTGPVWDGTPLGGRTILLTPEQGFGDIFQFARYASFVKADAGCVKLNCPPQLSTLLSRTPGIDWLPAPRLADRDKLSSADSTAGERHCIEFHVRASLLSLPGLFGTTLANVPANVPYLFADPERIDHWDGVLAEWPAFKIGIAWQGSRSYRGDAERSIPLACFAPLAQVPGVQLISLQKGEGTEQVAPLAGKLRLVELGPSLDQAGAFVDAAAVMRNLDLVVTSDTAIAHLAGGLGVPVWVALPFVCDWRWLLHREDSPWYPTMRLFRQPAKGNWQAVFERIAAELPGESGRKARSTVMPPPLRM